MTAAATPVKFPAGDVVLRGALFLPEQVDGPLPAVVVGGSWTTVRGQMADRYAAALAARGYAALSFDFTGYGESDGLPRDVEDPALKARDLRAALDFLSGHDRIDADRLGLLGICASAGYAALATTEPHRAAALVLVAPWLHDAALVRELYGGAPGVAERVEAGRQARAHYERTGEVRYVPAQSPTDQDAAMPMPADFYENPERGAIPGWSNRFAVLAWPSWLEFDAIVLGSDVDVPTLIVHSEDAAIPDGARRFHERLAGDTPITWLDGTQFDFYDDPAHVARATDAAVSHFDRQLHAVRR